MKKKKYSVVILIFFKFYIFIIGRIYFLT